VRYLLWVVPCPQEIKRLTRRSISLLCQLALVTLGSLPAVAQGDSPLIRISAGPDDQSTPLIYAAKAGIYKKYGLNVEMVKLGGSAAVTAALAGGSLEIGKASTMGLVTAFGKGLPFTAIGNLANYNADHPDFALVVASDGGIKTPKDLEGKTLAAVSLSDMNSIATFAWLDARGVDSSTLKYVEIPASATLAAMQQERVVASTLYEPNLSSALATGKYRILGYPYDAIAKRFSDGILFANASWASEHRDLVEKFLSATQEAASYLTAHSDEATALIVEYGALDPASVKTIRHPERGVALTPALIQPVIDAAAKYKVIPKAFNAADMICTCAFRK
jgi:NitT/TauT family transport system substrate-binding protein